MTVKKKKIDNCIARKYKEVYIFRYIDEYEKANKIHISEKSKANLVNTKQKTLKAILRLLNCRN